MSDEEDINEFITETKRNFDITARLKNRGLRTGSIFLFLEDETGLKYGWAMNERDQYGNETGRRLRQGVIGEIDELEAMIAELTGPEKTAAVTAGIVSPAEIDTQRKGFMKKKAALERKAEELLDELKKTGLLLKMRAVPPVIEKDTRRKARSHLGIKSKKISDEEMEEYIEVKTAFMLSATVQSVTDAATGATNDGLSFEEARDLMSYLPEGQFQRLDMKLGEVQYTDAISRSIEGQEDFS